MTIANAVNRNNYPGTGSVGPFAYNFKIFAATDLRVVKRNSLGVETVLAWPAQYTVTGVGLSVGGTVTLVTALAVGETLAIRRVRPLTQGTDLRGQSGFLPEVYEDALDHLTMLAQQHQDELSRKFGIDETLDSTAYDLIIPVGVNGQVIGWGPTGLTSFSIVTANGVALPGNGRTVSTLSAYLANNAVFNVKDYLEGAASVRIGLAACIAAAAAFAAINGGAEVRVPAGTYALGNLSGAETVFWLQGVVGLSIVSTDALFTCTTTDSTIPTIFLFDDCERIYCEGLRLNDAGADLTLDWKGANFITWRSMTVSAAILQSFTVRRCRTEKAVSFFTATGVIGGKKLRGITLDHCSATSTYYGIVCQGFGDDLAVRNFEAKNCRRVYFPYGVTGHDVDLKIEHDGIATGADSAILIKRYGGGTGDTHRIRCRAQFSGSGAQYTNAVSLELQPSAGVAIMTDIEVDLHIDYTLASPNTMRPVTFRSYTGAGVEEVTTTTNRWHRIKLCGNWGNYSLSEPVYLNVKQATEGILTIDAEVARGTKTLLPWYPGFVLRTAHDRETRTISGNLTTQVIKIPLASFDALGFILKIKTYAQDNYTSGVAQNAVYREDILICYNGGGGPVVIQVNTNLHTLNQGTAAGVVFTANGEDIDVSFTGALYNGANASAKVDVEYVSRGPRYIN